mmetsp:Transcript_33789/g.76402  ORF Transcript_33789/g.76402 Transcript_33789/m.76402 type:complete len:656 (+) Transcript_33789:418-2385(+)
MALASPYYQILRKNNVDRRNFKNFERKFAAEPKHLAEEIVVERNWVGASLLFEALNNSAPTSTLEDLIARYPEACVTKDANGVRPISVALRHNAPWSIIELLLQNTPAKTVKAYRGEAGGKLLFVGLRNNCPDEVVFRWLEKFPRSAQIRGGRYKLFPLQASLEFKRSPGVVAALLRAHSDAARFPDLVGRMPLHLAIETRAPYEIVTLLADAYPRALDTPVRMPQSQGSKKGALEPDEATAGLATGLATGLAEAEEEEEEGVISGAGPWDERGTDIKQGANLKDGDRCLHLALQSLCEDPVLGFILTKSPPDLVARRGANGDLPLHTSLRNRLGSADYLESMVRQGLSLRPPFDSASAKTPEGLTALLLGIETGAPEAFLLFLCQVSPSVVATPHPRTGHFPLVVALRAKCGTSLLGRLLALSPATAGLVFRKPVSRAQGKAASKDGGKRMSGSGYSQPPRADAEAAAEATTALHEAFRHLELRRHAQEATGFVLELINASPPSFLSMPSGDDKSLPIHLALANTGCPESVLNTLLDRFPQAARVLTLRGQTCFEIATKRKASPGVVARLGRMAPDLAFNSSRDAMPSVAQGSNHAALLAAFGRDPPRKAHDIALLARALPKGNWALQYSRKDVQQKGKNDSPQNLELLRLPAE